MGGESANEWVVPAIKGDNVPEIQRSQYNHETVYGRGSANICCLQAACDGWYWYHRDKGKARRVLESWEGYLGLDRWFTSEPWTSHRYGNWITMSYLAVAQLANKLGNHTVRTGIEDYIRMEMFATALTTGWTLAGSGKGYSYARGGSRSWCGWDGPNGKGTGAPYQHLVEEAGIGRNLNNWLGKERDANWEAEPIIQALEAHHNYQRWDFLTQAEKSLCLRLINQNAPLDANHEDDLVELVGKLGATGARSHIDVHFVKTTQGTGWLAEKTHGAGSTSFMVGKVWYAKHRNANENQQIWAGQYSKHYAPIFEGNKARRSDPGGFGSLEHDGSKFIFKAWTSDRDCANGYEPGPNKHNDGRDNPRNPDGWLDGPKVVTLGGNIVWHVKHTGKIGKWEILEPGGGTTPPPPPGNGDIPPGGWNTVRTPHAAYMKMNNQEVWDSLQRIKAGGHGSNHMITRECAVETRDVPTVEQQLQAIVDSWG